MEDTSKCAMAILNSITKFTRRITSGKIAPVYYGEDLPPVIAEAVRSARAMWIVGLPDSSFDIDGLFANCENRKLTSLSPAQNGRRIMFPCPMHNGLGIESRDDLLRRTQLAQNWGFDVKWVDRENLQSLIILNPPTEHDRAFDDGLAMIDLSLSNKTAQVKFEITQKDQSKIFYDLVRSFSHTWGMAHDRSYKKNTRVKTSLTGTFVA